MVSHPAVRLVEALLGLGLGVLFLLLWLPPYVGAHDPGIPSAPAWGVEEALRFGGQGVSYRQSLFDGALYALYQVFTGLLPLVLLAQAVVGRPWSRGRTPAPAAPR